MYIYSDFDQVIHDYLPTFLNVLRDVTGKLLKEEELSYKKVNLRDHLISDHGVSEEDFTKALDIASQSNEWDPTDFAHELIEFYLKRIEGGDDVIIVTARPFRMAVESIINQQTGGIEIPVVCCKSKNKYMIMKNGSIIFDDHPETAIKCAEEFQNSHIFVPRWLWNEHLAESPPSNLTVLEQHEIAEDINKYVNMALSKNICFNPNNGCRKMVA